VKITPNYPSKLVESESISSSLSGKDMSNISSARAACHITVINEQLLSFFKSSLSTVQRKLKR
jgi:hypothetical protein